MMGFATPQWIMLVLLLLQIIAGVSLHGSVRKDPTWNGAMIVCEALLLIALLGWGGFWNRHP